MKQSPPMRVRVRGRTISGSRVAGRLRALWSAVRHAPVRDALDIPKLRLMRAVKPYTMLSYARLSKLADIATELERLPVAGSFVECGVWNGGSAAVMAHAAQGPHRPVWLFDSWEGLPDAEALDVSFTGEPGEMGMARGSVEAVHEVLFERLRLPRDAIRFVHGWFQETLPDLRGAVGPIALLHMDCDWYESVKCCLEQLYDQVVAGGYVVVDDYGHWEGCRRAVDEFLTARGVTAALTWVDYTGVYFRK